MTADDELLSDTSPLYNTFYALKAENDALRANFDALKDVHVTLANKCRALDSDKAQKDTQLRNLQQLLEQVCAEGRKCALNNRCCVSRGNATYANQHVSQHTHTRTRTRTRTHTHTHTHSGGLSSSKSRWLSTRPSHRRSRRDRSSRYARESSRKSRGRTASSVPHSSERRRAFRNSSTF